MMTALAAIPCTAPHTGEDHDWTPLRRLTLDRLRELRTIDQRYALIHFHATRADGGGYVSLLDPGAQIHTSHLFELQALGITAYGETREELVRNFMRLLGDALKHGTA